MSLTQKELDAVRLAEEISQKVVGIDLDVVGGALTILMATYLELCLQHDEVEITDRERRQIAARFLAATLQHMLGRGSADHDPMFTKGRLQ